jgi:ketosteroid isomerase-like protein
MTDQLRASIERLFAAVEAKDLPAVLAGMTDDALLSDPHYPQPEMRGKSAITKGLTWGFGSIEKFGFTIVHYYETADGRGAVVEVDTNHVVKGGMKLHFPQIFVVDSNGTSITRVKAYEPYGPHGINAAVLVITRLVWKLTGKM